MDIIKSVYEIDAEVDKNRKQLFFIIIIVFNIYCLLILYLYKIPDMVQVNAKVPIM